MIPLKQRFAVPYYETRDVYKEKTGAEPPPFDPNRRIQLWEKADAVETWRNTGLTLIGPVLAVDRLTGYALKNAQGKPYTEDIALKTVEIQHVNIPPPGANVVYSTPGASVEWQCPLEPLAADGSEYLDWLEAFLGSEFPSNVGIRNKSEDAAPQPVAFTSEDHRLIKGIAARLSVT
jgi:hypothetical protein